MRRSLYHTSIIGSSAPRKKRGRRRAAGAAAAAAATAAAKRNETHLHWVSDDTFRTNANERAKRAPHDQNIHTPQIALPAIHEPGTAATNAPIQKGLCCILQYALYRSGIPHHEQLNSKRRKRSNPRGEGRAEGRGGVIAKKTRRVARYYPTRSTPTAEIMMLFV